MFFLVHSSIFLFYFRELHLIDIVTWNKIRGEYSEQLISATVKSSDVHPCYSRTPTNSDEIISPDSESD